eukprot:TRINITY_DN15295_c0_g1_i1.p1 TRINITY_DN15295_c0_g1~~TRINITY_DN15295_c0_g1_i1.p1  ORF type:complete len:422 (-),score=95.75 TRINITY_DN15295_c0_g1_i1:25-1290(-)
MSVVLKISFASEDAESKNYRTVKFDTALPVADVVKQFASRQQITNHSDYGLFVNESDERDRHWLQSDKTLGDYTLDITSLLEFKKKTRLLRVELLDDTHKTMPIDDTWPVSDIVQRACKKYGIDENQADEFSLQSVGSRDVDWLLDNRSLRDQHISESAVVILRRKYFSTAKDVSTLAGTALHVLYVQIRRDIVTGQLPCSMQDAVQLAALQLQADSGSAENVQASQLDLDRLLAPVWRKMRGIEDDIVKQRKVLSGVVDDDAKRRYLAVCQKFRVFGTTIFPAKDKPKGAKKFTLSIMLAVGREGVFTIDAQTKEVLAQFPLNQIRRWAVTDNSFTLDIGEYRTYKVNDARLLGALLSGYVELLIKHDPKLQAVVASAAALGLAEVTDADRVALQRISELEQQLRTLQMEKEASLARAKV